MGFFSRVWSGVKDVVGDVGGFIVDAHLTVFTAGANIWGDKAWTWFKHMLIPDMRRDREAMVNSSTSTRRIVYGRTRVGGNLVYAETSGGANEYLNIIVVFTGHAITGYDEIWFNDQLAATVSGGVVTVDAAFSGFVTIELHDGTQTAASPEMLAQTHGNWTADHKLLGCAYGYFRLKYDEAKYAAGIPAVKAVLRGKPVYDPRTAMTGWSDNPALCISDYMLMSGTIGGMGCSPDEVPTDSVITAANICDQAIAAADNEKRYTLNGFISLDQTPASILKPMLSAMSGQALYSGGEWTIYAGAPAATVVTLDESWLNGGISFSTGSNKGDLINTAKGTFTNPADHWADTEFPTVINEAYLSADYEELTADLPMPFTTSQTMAQRLATIEIEKSRRGMVVNYPCNLKAAHLDVMDCVAINNDRLGWAGKLFRIMSWGFSPTGGIDLSLVEDDAGIWADPSTYGELAPPPLTNLPDPYNVLPPTSFTATEVLYSGVAIANTKSRLDLSWISAQASGTSYDIAFDGTVISNTTDTVYSITDLAPSTYDVSVRARNGLGAVSPWVTIVKVVEGKYTPPANVSGFSATFAGNLIKLAWTPINEPDLAGYEIRTGASWEAGTILQAALMGNGYTYRPTASGAITHWIKAFDTAGNESVTAATSAAVVPVPDVPTAITATAQFLSIDLAITYDLSRQDTAGVQIWAATTNNRDTAALVGASRDGRWQQSGLNNAEFRYYWARCVSVFDEVGAWYPAGATSGVLGATLNDPTQAIKLLNGDVSNTKLTDYLAGTGSFSDVVDTFTPAALPGVGVEGVFATQSQVVNATITILDDEIQLKASSDDLSGQVLILFDMIGLKLNATGTVGPGLAIAWQDETQTKSIIRVQSDLFQVGDDTGSGFRNIFSVGNINGVPAVGVLGDAVIDGTLSADAFASSLAFVSNTLIFGDATHNGVIETHNYDAESTGIRITGGGSPSISVKGGAITGGEITGTIITGSTLQTAATGERFVVDAASKAAHFYNSSDVEKVFIGTASKNGINAYGVFGDGAYGDGRVGIAAWSNTYFAIYAVSNSGAAIIGASTSSQGVQGTSSTSFGGYFSGGKGPICLQSADVSSAPTHQSNKGTLWVTSLGVLYINTDNSTTWQKVGSQ